ncbi:MAG: glycoside hydrolase family 130 protein [Ignavibacteriaceae bacterium]
MQVERTELILKPDQSRVLFLPFKPEREEQILKIVARVLSLTTDEVDIEIEEVCKEFGDRHHNLFEFYLKRFDQISSYLISDRKLRKNRKMLIGAYFTQEYSLESAALFNPSIVLHPDQSNLPKGSVRFVLSLRATGEGHISSIVFRSGTIDVNNNISIEKPARFVTAPEVIPNPLYEKPLFERKLFELGLVNEFTNEILSHLGDVFLLNELEECVESTIFQIRMRDGQNKVIANGILSLARSNYEIVYDENHHLSERIIFPHSPTETNGIEDARFVRFLNDDGSYIYYASYTAFDGKVILPQLLETTDFLSFKINTLNGPEVQNKGMALFPRKIDGMYAMLSRQDNENIYIMFSDNIHFWNTKKILLRPTFTWEMVLIGNCGSPIETEKGWLVLSHGVGPMRKYSIGAFLLDLQDPTKVIGRLEEPLLDPSENERVGYVPNVVYSCGSMINGDELIIPYAMSDYASSFAKVNVNELLNELTSS